MSIYNDIVILTLLHLHYFIRFHYKISVQFFKLIDQRMSVAEHQSTRKLDRIQITFGQMPRNMSRGILLTFHVFHIFITKQRPKSIVSLLLRTRRRGASTKRLCHYEEKLFLILIILFLDLLLLYIFVMFY